MNHCGGMMIVRKVLVGKKYPKFVASVASSSMSYNFNTCFSNHIWIDVGTRAVHVACYVEIALESII
jgi:hypothetical protein